MAGKTVATTQTDASSYSRTLHLMHKTTHGGFGVCIAVNRRQSNYPKWAPLYSLLTGDLIDCIGEEIKTHLPMLQPSPRGECLFSHRLQGLMRKTSVGDGCVFVQVFSTPTAAISIFLYEFEATPFPPAAGPCLLEFFFLFFSWQPIQLQAISVTVFTHSLLSCSEAAVCGPVFEHSRSKCRHVPLYTHIHTFTAQQ